MYISDANSARLPDTSFARKGWVKSPQVIEQIASMGVTEIYIDIELGRNTDAGDGQELVSQKQNKIIDDGQAKPHHRPAPKVEFEEEYALAKQVQSEAHELVSKVMQDAKMGKPIEISAAQESADSILQSLENNQNALLCLTHLRCKDRYLLEHSFNVSVLMGVLASSAGIKREQLQTLVSGALLHDLGKIQIDDAILHKPGRLDNDEWEEMKRHVTYGEDIVSGIAGLAPEILDIVAQHHERLDGSGYPRGLTADQLPLHSRMASVVDVYDAVTADRVYHRGMPPSTALKKMLEWSDDSHLDKSLVLQFIRSLSVYPCGALVLLDTQQIAVVESVNPEVMDKPIVRVVYDAAKQMLREPFVVDLNSQDNKAVIVKAIDPDQSELDLQAVLQAAFNPES